MTIEDELTRLDISDDRAKALYMHKLEMGKEAVRIQIKLATIEKKRLCFETRCSKGLETYLKTL